MKLDEHYQERLYDMEMETATTTFDLAIFKSLKPRLFKDGDQWCCLYGESIQEGIVGFGNTPYNAILEFNKEFISKE